MENSWYNLFPLGVSTRGLDWVCGGCSIKHLVSHTVFLASKSRENRRKQPHFCQRNSEPLFAYSPHPFWENKKIVPPSSFCVAHTPTKWHFYFQWRFSRPSSSRSKGSRQTTHNEKMRKPALAFPLLGIIVRQNELPLFLLDFEVFEDFLHCFLGGCHQHCFDKSHRFLF